MVKYEGTSFMKGNKVKIYDGNSDGSIPGTPEYAGKILEILPGNRALVDTNRNEKVAFHLSRLTKTNK